MKKKFFLSALFISFLLFMVYFFMIYPKEVIEGAVLGMSLWFTSVFPSLFPFLVIINILSYLGFVELIGTLLSPIMLAIFKIKGSGAFAYISGVISGYPVGAKVTADLRHSGDLTRSEADRLIMFANHAGPLFLLGTVGVNMFENIAFGYGLIISHILAGIFIGVIMGAKVRYVPKKASVRNNLLISAYKNQSIKLKSCPKLGDVLGKSIISAMDISLQVGGFIIFFSVISKILLLSGYIYTFSKPLSSLLGFDIDACNALIMGLIEMTNGLKLLSLSYISMEMKFVLSAFLTGFGGISILLQALSLISITDISINRHILGKLLHGVVGGSFAYILLSLDLVNLNTASAISVFNTFSHTYNYSSIFYMLLISLFVVSINTILSFIAGQSR